MLCGGYGGTQQASNYCTWPPAEMPFYTNVADVDPQRVGAGPAGTKAATLKTSRACATSCANSAPPWSFSRTSGTA